MIASQIIPVSSGSNFDRLGDSAKNLLRQMQDPPVKIVSEGSFYQVNSSKNTSNAVSAAIIDLRVSIRHGPSP